MKTIEIILYSFSELSKEVQANVVNNQRSFLYGTNNLMDGFEEACKERGQGVGLIIEKLVYSLSYSQGDGVSFNGKPDLLMLIGECFPDIDKPTKDSLFNAIQYRITENRGRYAFASKSDVDIWTEEDDQQLIGMCETLCKKLEDKYMDLCQQLETFGYEWIEGQTSDKAIIENIEANEYAFEEDGTMRNA